MANSRISQLPPAGALQDTDLFAVVQNTGSGLLTSRTSLNDLKLNIISSGSTLNYKGTWNATTNSPAIPAAGPGNKGWYYVVNVAGAQDLNGTGIVDYQPTDWIVSNGVDGWDKIDNSDTLGANYLDISHAALLAAISSNGLVPGGLYHITDFQTIHVIPETTDVHTGPVEPLVCLALTDNTLSGLVWSEQNPFDIIEYDVMDIEAEDTLTPRKGKITYRKDTKKNLETWYDFRNVKFRRWSLDGTGMDTWAPDTFYSAGKNIFITNKGIYQSNVNHTSDATNFDNDYQTGKWVLLFAYWDVHAAWRTTMNEFGGDPVTANPAVYTDFNTFGESCMNIRVPKSFMPYNNIVVYDGVVNYTFGNNCSNITVGGANYAITGSQNSIGDNSSGIMILSSSEIRIGENGYGIIVTGTVGTSIGKRGRFIFLHSADYNTVGDNCSVVNFGVSCIGNVINSNSNKIMLLIASGNNRIESNTWDIFLIQSSNNKIGINSSGNRFTSSYTNTIGSDSQNNTFNRSSYNVIGSNCSNNSLAYAVDNTIGNFCTNNAITHTTYSSTNQGNKIGDYCTYNTISNSYNNIIHNNCNSNLIEHFAAANEIFMNSNSNSLGYGSEKNIIGKGCENNTIVNGSLSNIIGDGCSGNNISNGSSSNVIGDGSNDNTISSGSSYNVIGRTSHSNLISQSVFNCRIGDNSITNTITTSASNSVIGNNSSSNTITTGSTDVHIGDNCIMNSLTNGAVGCVIGDFASSNTLSQGGPNFIGHHSNGNILIQGAVNTIIGNYSNDNSVSQSSTNNTIGDNSSNNVFIQSSSYNVIGNFSGTNQFNQASTHNLLSHNCGNNTFTGTSVRNKLDAFCSDNVIRSSSDNYLYGGCLNNKIGVAGTGGTYVGASKNILKQGCNNLHFIGSNNTFEQNCSFIECLKSMGIENCYFAANVKNISFDYTTWSAIYNMKIMLPTNNTLALMVTPEEYNNLVFNMIDSGGNLWANSIDTVGTITTVKLS